MNAIPIFACKKKPSPRSDLVEEEWGCVARSEYLVEEWASGVTAEGTQEVSGRGFKFETYR